MTDATHPPHDPLEDGALVAAWLAGDLDGSAAEAVEERLAREPDLAARADRVARSLVALRRPDGAALPDGAAARLRERLDRERPMAADADADADADEGGAGGGRTGAGAAVADLGAARRRRQGWARGLGTAAAAVVLVAGVGGVVGQLATGGGEEAAMETTMMDESAGGADTAEDAAGDSAGGGGAEQDAGGEGAGEAPAGDPDPAPPPASGMASEDATVAEEMASESAALDGVPQPPGPVVLDQGVVLGGGLPEGSDGAARVPDGSEGPATGGPVLAQAPPELENEVRERFAAVPEATALLGTPREQANPLAAATSDALRSAPPFDDGVRPDACIDAVLSGTALGAGGTPVIARVEQVTLDGSAALVHVLVTGDAATPALDDVRVVVTAAATCAPLVDVGR